MSHYSDGCYCVECRKLRGEDKSMDEMQNLRDAVKDLKKCVRLLFELDSKEAAAPVSIKLLDAFDNLTNGHPNDAADDVWACSLAIQRVLYRSFALKFGKPEIDIEFDSNCDGYNKYLQATIELVDGTGFEALFLKEN
jgi:hypothetical protein